MISDKSPPAHAPQRYRIAIIPATFDPRLQYQENIFAATLHRMGHEVTVFTSTHGFQGKLEDLAGLDAAMPFRVVRTAKVIGWKSTQFPWDPGMGRSIHQFRPQVAFLLAPNHGLGARWVKHLPRDCRVIAGFSDLPWHRGGLSSWIKRRWANRVIRRADKVITATGETDALVREWAGVAAADKVENVGLTFAPESLDGGTLPAPAVALTAKVRYVIACVTRVAAGKQLDVLFRSVERYLQAHPDAGLVMAGFDDGVESSNLKALLAASSVADRCVALPLLSGPEIGALFRMASCSVWSLVSIGIYHSLHCGCPVLVREGQDASHLLKNPDAGRWYASLEQIDQVIPQVLSQQVPRETVACGVQRFHSERVLMRLLEEVSPAA